MSELAALIAQLSGSGQPPAQDPALAAVKLARASLDALVLKLGQSIDARVVAQLAAGLTQLTAGAESFVLKLETPLPLGTAVTIKVAQTPQGTPAVTVSVPAATPQSAQPMPVPTPTAPLVQAPSPQPATATPYQQAPQATQLAQATQLPLPNPATPPPPVVAATASLGQPPQSQPQAQPTSLAAPRVQQTALATSATPVAAPAPPAEAPAGKPAAAPLPLPQASAAAAPPPASQPLVPASQQTAPSLAQPASPLPAPGQPAAQVTLPVTPPAPAPSVMSAQPQAAPAPTATAATTPPAAPAAPTAPPAAVAPPPSSPAASAPQTLLTTSLAAQPQQPLPTHPSPYPVQVPQSAAPAVARQLPLTRAVPPLNLADPAQAAARQDSAAPLLAKLATLVTATAPSLPRPVIEIALKLLANRVDLNRGAPDAKTLEAAVLKAGVLLTPLTRQPAADSKSALLALRSALLAFLGGYTAAPVTAAERPAPPLKGEPPRAPAAQPALADLPADGLEAARSLLGHADAALSRLKLLQSASQPAADSRPEGPAPRTEVRVEIPMMLGAETGILQLMVERDGKHKREPERQRGWRMRFAMSFSATGEVGADIALLGHSASVAIWAADPGTADALDQLLPELGPAIQRHGLELTSLRVRRGAPQHARTAPGQLLDSAR